jgi:hypothetical protein
MDLLRTPTFPCLILDHLPRARDNDARGIARGVRLSMLEQAARVNIASQMCLETYHDVFSNIVLNEVTQSPLAFLFRA